jgi:glycosyltransferase involved in cell wall biosynthesis
MLAVGSLVHPKGFHVLVQACALLRKQGIPFKCRIVGEGYERRNLVRLARDLSIEDAVDMAGALPFRAVRELYRLATVFVMPSVPSPKGSDGLPTVLIEAMALGTPVVASNHAGIPDLVRHRETGLLVKPGGPEALAECIIELLTDSGLRGRLALNGRRLIEAEFDLQHNVAELVRLMEQSVRKA